MIIPPGLAAVPITAIQKDLLLDLVQAIKVSNSDQIQPFKAIKNAADYKLRILHQGMSESHEGAFLGDLRALASERLIDIEAEKNDEIPFTVTDKGVEAAKAIISLRVSGQEETNWISGKSHLTGVRPFIPEQNNNSGTSLPEWGGRWKALSTSYLAQRGQSRIWKVWDIREEKTPVWKRNCYALKELKDASVNSSKFKRFVREIEKTKELAQEKSSIISVVDYAVPNPNSSGKPYYVMPLAGSSLARAKDLQGRLETVIEIGLVIADALVAAHNKGIIHRDVKPDNILLFEDERRPVLADFGICYLTNEDRLTGLEAHTVGSKDFVAPELQGGGTVDSIDLRADIYSLGKTLYAVVAGGEIFPREFHRAEKWDLVKRFNDQRLAHLHGLLDQMVTVDPNARFPSMLDCYHQLERALANVRLNRVYRPGMYGGRYSSLERYARIKNQLENHTEHLKSDALQDANTDMVESVQIRASVVNSDNTILSGSALSKRPEAMVIAAETAEELLAVGIAVGQNNDVSAIRKWLASLNSLTKNSADESTLSDAYIIPPAITIAFYGVGGFAWYRSRLQILRYIVEAQMINRRMWVHHNILGEVASAVVPWVTDVLKSSPIISAADQKFKGFIEKSVEAVAGLIVIKVLLSMNEDQWLTWFNDDFFVEAFPGIYNWGWINEIPRRFLEDPDLEKEIAIEIFDMDVLSLRKKCKDVTPLIGRMISRALASQNRNSYGVSRLFSSSWVAWCGGSF